MIVLSLLSGIAVGVIQCFLLGELTARVTGKKKGSLSVIIVMKLAVYVLAVATAFFAFREQLLYCGLGYAAAMTITSVILFAVSSAGR